MTQRPFRSILTLAESPIQEASAVGPKGLSAESARICPVTPSMTRISARLSLFRSIYASSFPIRRASAREE